MNQSLTVSSLLTDMVNMGASDLHLAVGVPPSVRIEGELKILDAMGKLTEMQVSNIIFSCATPAQKDLFNINRDLDFSYTLSEKARFRVNAYWQKSTPAASFRKIPFEVPDLASLNLPANIIKELCNLPQGLVLITGPSGQGKSTTLAAMINYINNSRSSHIITIEDPIEYIFTDNKSTIHQRELHTDTFSWEVALRSVLRQDPNVVLIGEMRDLETISSAITIAETGHLVLATLHTNSASQTVDRIIDVFPESQQNQVRVQLSLILEGVISQRLVPGIHKGRFPACEILLTTPALQNLIREGKTHQIDNIIVTSQDIGMKTLEMSLADLVFAGKITVEEAKKHSMKPADLARLVSKKYADI